MTTYYRKLHADDVAGEHGITPALLKPHDLLPSLLPALTAFLRRFLRNADEAHDFAQEAAVRALGAKDVPQSRQAYRAWLYQIARHAAIDAHRRRVREDIAPDLLNPWAADRSLITALSVRQALMQISDDQRRILLLVDVEGLSYVEAARQLGVPEGTVMSRVSRARAALLAVINRGEQVE
jgi:RNA polymerase sigma-70 factor (ECF subfamily)